MPVYFNNSVSNEKQSLKVYSGDVADIPTLLDGRIIFDLPTSSIYRDTSGTRQLFSDGSLAADAWVRGGNAFGDLGVFGTNDDNDIQIIRNGQQRMYIDGDNVYVNEPGGNTIFNIDSTDARMTLSPPLGTYNILDLSEELIQLKTKAVTGGLVRMHINGDTDIADIDFRNVNVLFRDTDVNGGDVLAQFDGDGGEVYFNSSEGGAGAIRPRFFIGDGAQYVTAGFNDVEYRQTRDGSDIVYAVDHNGNIFQDPIRSAFVKADLAGTLQAADLSDFFNIYNADGTLSGDRVLSGDNDRLTFQDLFSFDLDVNDTINITSGNTINLQATDDINLNALGAGSSLHFVSDNDFTLDSANGVYIGDNTALSLDGDTGQLLVRNGGTIGSDSGVAPVFTNYIGSSGAVALSAPAAWINVQVSGTPYGIPCFLQ